jgi:sarcosine oxidase subunit gamma
LAPIFQDAELRIEELDLGKALVRCHRSRIEATSALVTGVCGWTLPFIPNTVAVQAAGRALALEPGAWMLTGARGGIAAAVAAITQRPADPMTGRILTADVSGGRCLLKLSGTGARPLIESGCPVDLHPRAFAKGRCASTLFNETPIIVDQLSDDPAYVLIVDRTSALSLWDLLIDAARWLIR